MLGQSLTSPSARVTLPATPFDDLHPLVIWIHLFPWSPDIVVQMAEPLCLPEFLFIPTGRSSRCTDPLPESFTGYLSIPFFLFFPPPPPRSPTGSISLFLLKQTCSYLSFIIVHSASSFYHHTSCAVPPLPNFLRLVTSIRLHIVTAVFIGIRLLSPTGTISPSR